MAVLISLIFVGALGLVLAGFGGVLFLNSSKGKRID